MSKYTERLHDFINGYEFVRCFYGTCPDCGKHVFSVGDNVVNNRSIKAKFICSCGRKWKEIVYSPEMRKYKYRQALVEDYYNKEGDKFKVLKLGKRIFLVTPEEIKSKEVKQ